MTQFHIFVMLTNGQFINRERQFGNNIFLRTVAYVLHGGGQLLIPHDKNFVILLIKFKDLNKHSLKRQIYDRLRTAHNITRLLKKLVAL